MLFATVALCTC